jgi:alpha-beta hydrolase superfamily lysophospholipase
MIDDTDFFMTAPDGLEIFVRHSRAEDAEGVVVISHGMAEHSGRYSHVAEALVEAGYHVYIPDHRGHGLTAARAKDEENKTLGHFGDQNGWHRVVRDLRGLIAYAKEAHPDLPLILIGHSMGSFIAQEVLYKDLVEIDALALSGTGIADLLVSVGITVAKIERAIFGRRKPGPFLGFVAKRKFSKHIKDAHKTHAWLSRDPQVCRDFLSDSLCGFDLTSQGAIDMMTALKDLHKNSRMERIPKKLPVYIFGGTEDALSWDGEAARWLVTKYQMLGIKPVRHKLYEGGRHESFNEINKEEVIQGFIGWCDSVVRQWKK